VKHRFLSDGPKKLTCRFCQATFYGWKKLRTHIESEHVKELAQLNRPS